MREMNLTFRNPDEVLDFVKTVEQYPFDMDLCRGSVVVDAKSLLGIMNLGFNQTVNLSTKQHNSEDFQFICSPIPDRVASAILSFILRKIVVESI